MQLSKDQEKIYDDGIQLGLEKSKYFRDNAVLVVADLLSQRKGIRLEQIRDESKRLVYINKAKGLLGLTASSIRGSDGENKTT